MERALSFDDVCLIPQYSEIVSRSHPDPTVCLMGKRYTNESVQLRTPVISSNMDTITEHAMAIAMCEAGGIGAIHRFMSVDKQVEEFKLVQVAGAQCFMTLGITDFMPALERLYVAGARRFIIDIAHGHSVLMKNALTSAKARFPTTLIMAGNVATAEGVRDLAKWGADVVKVGVGGGSICKTRMVTGHGVPMFSCIQECSAQANTLGVQIVADGGIKTSGDIVKAIAGGADAVMLGSLLSGTDETPGITIETPAGNDFGDVVRMKSYRGMASAEAQGSRQWGSNGVKVAPEGVATYVHCKGPVKEIIHELTMGLKSGMSYCNAMTLQQVQWKAVWREQSHSAFVEGTPHILRK